MHEIMEEGYFRKNSKTIVPKKVLIRTCGLLSYGSSKMIQKIVWIFGSLFMAQSCKMIIVLAQRLKLNVLVWFLRKGRENVHSYLGWDAWRMKDVMDYFMRPEIIWAGYWICGMASRTGDFINDQVYRTIFCLWYINSCWRCSTKTLNGFCLAHTSSNFFCTLMNILITIHDCLLYW